MGHQCKGLCGVNARLAECLNSVLNVEALLGVFNQEKALVDAFLVIVNLRVIFVKVRLKL